MVAERKLQPEEPVVCSLTAGLQDELHLLPPSLPPTHWLMRLATPTFKPSASCAGEEKKIHQHAGAEVDGDPLTYGWPSMGSPGGRCVSGCLRAQTGSSWRRRARRDSSGPSASEPPAGRPSWRPKWGSGRSGVSSPRFPKEEKRRRAFYLEGLCVQLQFLVNLRDDNRGRSLLDVTGASEEWRNVHVC